MVRGARSSWPTSFAPPAKQVGEDGSRAEFLGKRPVNPGVEPTGRTSIDSPLSGSA
jgi:hypothetical protein